MEEDCSHGRESRKTRANRKPVHDACQLRALTHFFVGLPNVEAARLLGIPERSAKRVWAYARAWLHRNSRRPSETFLAQNGRESRTVE